MITISQRKLLIPQGDRLIGFTGDNLVETRIFSLCDKSLFDMDFRVDIDNTKESALVEKSSSPDGETLYLKWEITSAVLNNTGKLIFQIRGFESEGDRVWHSEKNYFYVSESIDVEGEVTAEQLSQFHEIEKNVTEMQNKTKEYCEQSQQYCTTAQQSAKQAQVDIEKLRQDIYIKDEVYTKGETSELIQEGDQIVMQHTNSQVDRLESVIGSIGEHLGNNVYTKVETDQLIHQGDQNALSIISGIQDSVEGALGAMWKELDNVYNKEETQELLKNKPNKNEVNNLLIGKTSGSAIGIVDVSPIEHTLKVKVSNLEDIEDVTQVRVIKSGGNLLDVEGREVVNFGANANTTQRGFTGKGIIKGIAYNNYYTPSNVVSFEKHKNGFSFSNKANQTPYGIGFDFKSSPNITYVVRYEGVENVSGSSIFLSEYDKDGNFLRYQFPKNTADTKAKMFTTGENTVWVVISIQNKVEETIVDYNDVFIGIDTFSGFEEYKEPVTYAVNADGTVEGVTSLYPCTTLLTDTEGAVIEVEYNRDINKVIEQLTNAIISLGGNV